ncbi:MAG: hypothetical protein JO299_07660 [Gammaproteobacteria bacterium]|nr:hypothetical protein [Gammaproteobacteria bacterium]
MSAKQTHQEGRPRAIPVELQAQTREIAVGFLWSELDVADTLVSVAETTAHYETAVRNLQNAWLALEAAQKYAEQLDLDATERNTFRALHGTLCVRLADLQVRSQD